jgi:hypothetical protein
MVQNEPAGLVKDRLDDPGDAARSDEFLQPIHERPRESWYGAAPTVVALGAIGALAVAGVVSAVLFMSREPVGPTGAVVPTIQTTAAPPSPPPATASTSPPAPTRAPSSPPPVTSSAIATTTAAPSPTQPPPKSPETSASHPPTTRPPISVHPTPQPVFPQQPTEPYPHD